MNILGFSSEQQHFSGDELSQLELLSASLAGATELGASGILASLRELYPGMQSPQPLIDLSAGEPVYQSQGIHCLAPNHVMSDKKTVEAPFDPYALYADDTLAYARSVDINGNQSPPPYDASDSQPAPVPHPEAYLDGLEATVQPGSLDHLPPDVIAERIAQSHFAQRQLEDAQAAETRSQFLLDARQEVVQAAP